MSTRTPAYRLRRRTLRVKQLHPKQPTIQDLMKTIPKVTTMSQQNRRTTAVLYQQWHRSLSHQGQIPSCLRTSTIKQTQNRPGRPVIRNSTSKSSWTIPNRAASRRHRLARAATGGKTQRAACVRGTQHVVSIRKRRPQRGGRLDRYRPCRSRRTTISGTAELGPGRD
jgi:hypothetical protein